MFTPQSLLALALEAEARYAELRKQFPPGTYNLERNEARRAAEQALLCAEWMERTGRTELAFVGPFGTLPFSAGSRVRIRRGAVVRTTRPGTPRGGEPTGRARVVTLHFVDAGGVFRDRGGPEEVVRQPLVTWSGTGSYWCSADANDVELVS